MAKRFIDTSFYRSPFVRGLKGSLKALYSFIICDCDAAGIWAADFEIASIYIDQKVTQKEFEQAFLQPGKAIDLGNGKYFFPDFIEHQYPKGLSEKNPAQINIIFELKKYNLIDEKLKPLPRPFQGSKVMVKVMDKEKVMEMVKVNAPEKIPFDDFWNLYAKKVGDQEKIKPKWDKLSITDQQQAMVYIPMYKQAQPDKQFRKNPETFLNNKGWKDEIVIKSNGKQAAEDRRNEVTNLKNLSLEVLTRASRPQDSDTGD